MQAYLHNLGGRTMRIGIIGYGHLGKALVRGLVEPVLAKTILTLMQEHKKQETVSGMNLRIFM